MSCSGDLTCWRSMVNQSPIPPYSWEGMLLISCWLLKTRGRRWCYHKETYWVWTSWEYNVPHPQLSGSFLSPGEELRICRTNRPISHLYPKDCFLKRAKKSQTIKGMKENKTQDIWNDIMVEARRLGLFPSERDKNRNGKFDKPQVICCFTRKA